MARLSRPLAVVLAVLLLAGVAGATLPAGREFVVRDADTGQLLLREPVHDGDRVTLAYNHSVEKTPVRDIYAVQGTTLDNVEMRFQSYGWGLPAREYVDLESGWFVFDPDRQYDSIVVQPSPAADHRLVVGGHTYDLVELSDGRSVRLEVERRSVLSTVLQ